MPPKPKTPTLEELRKERNTLMITKADPERLQWLKDKVDFFEYGIVRK